MPGVQSEVTAYWDARAPHFDAVASHVAQAEVWRAVLGAAFAADGPRDVIDLGTGTGACALAAAALGHRVRAYDGSAGMLAVAREAARRSGAAIDFVQATLEEAALPPTGADIVTLRNVLWTLERPQDALAAARRALRPGGRVVVSDGLWSVAPQSRSTYPADLAARLPFHAGLREDDAVRLLAQAGFAAPTRWGHLLPASAYPGAVPVFVLAALVD